MMRIKEAVYLSSNTDYQKCPDAALPEYAFIGRSNVGKSSLINMLTGVKDLAKTSSKPGKTQLINHFLIDKAWYLVDLPGYGYAQISKAEREKWQKMTHDYLFNRSNLVCTFVLVDSRLEPQRSDLEFMQMLGEKGLPFHVVFTKADKLSGGRAAEQVSAYRNRLLETWSEPPAMFVTSAATAEGASQLLEVIRDYNALFRESKTD